MSILISKISNQIKLTEALLSEGKHWHWPEDYRQKAIKRIRLATDTSTYSDAKIEQDVDKMMTKFKDLLHTNSNVGYFLPVIRMFIDYAGNDQAKRKEFVDTKMDMLVKNLGIISQDPSLESKFKDDIKQKWSLEDFEKAAVEIQVEIDKADVDSLASVGSSESSDYDVISINSYEELNEKFGGDKTGYKGQSEWCHTNGKSTYDSWTDGGTKQFFVLAKKGWENIQPPDPKTTNAFDEYGTSLIAILVSVKDSELLRATLRWNHVIDPSETVPKTGVDRAFLGWGDLSKAVGFNVKAVVDKELKRILTALDAKSKTIILAINDKLKTVTEIDEDTLTKDEKRFITHLDIPDNITRIGYRAFAECHSLISVTIPNSVTSIDYSAFYHCPRLTNVTIPNSVTEIGERAFSDCYEFTSVTIPDSVTYIGSYAFTYCTRLTSVTIGNGVTNISKGAFSSCKGLTSVTIPNSVKSIGEGAFSLCKGLTSVTIPNSVKSIANSAFWKCFNLTNVTIGNSVMNIGEYVFFGCSDLTSVTIPASVTKIGNYAFYDCDKLSSVTFEGKTLDEVKATPYYPWGIENPKKIITASELF